MERLHSDENHRPLCGASGKKVVGGSGIGPAGGGSAGSDREELEEPAPCIRTELFWVEVQGGVMDYAHNLALDSPKAFGKSAPALSPHPGKTAQAHISQAEPRRPCSNRDVNNTLSRKRLRRPPIGGGVNKGERFGL